MAHTQHHTALSQDPKVITAVEFLDEVSQKGHKEGELRKYLFNRKELSRAQIDEAFRIHRLRLKKKAEVAIPRSSTGRKEKVVDRENSRGIGERPEISTVDDARKGPTFLLEEKRVEGQKLITDFLKTEFSYVSVLECLKNEYFRDLCQLASTRKIVFTRTELNQMFQRIPELLIFHKALFQNLSNQHNNIGQVFVHLFHHFKEYVEYTKDCTAMIITMRKHIHDKKLHRILEKIREKSSRNKDDMVDLLLIPLDRIMDYKEFLDKLHGWADQDKGADYVYLGKAARRIGRIANYIAKHRGGIWNRNEMNKVQQFLSKQCNILTAKRRIIRRGLMIRRTTSWPVRKKHYIFFLFSDVLLWTSRNGELQNVVRLQDCEVMHSESKTNPERKFKIVSKGKNRVRKVLLLECNLKRQRDEWFSTVQQEIKNSKQTIPQKNGVDDFMQFLAMNTDPVCTTPPPEGSGAAEEAKCSSPVVENDDLPTSGAHLRYQHSENFPNSEFLEEFAPIDDAVSVTSEDPEPYSGMPKKEKYGDSMDKLLPITVNSRRKLEESKETPKVFRSEGRGPPNSRSTITNENTYHRYNPNHNGVTTQDTNRNTNQYSKDEDRIRRSFVNEETPGGHSNSIIRREKDDLSSSTGSVKMLENNSSFTIRLTEFF